MSLFVRAQVNAVKAATQPKSPLAAPLNPGSFSSIALPAAPPPTPPPSPVTPTTLYPDLPTGGDWESILMYFINHAVPTYKLVDLQPSQAFVAFGFVMLDLIFGIPCTYFYLDNSLVSQDDYYIYRYLYYGMNSPVQPSVGPSSNSSGPMTLICADTSALPANAYFAIMGNPTAPFTLPNPMLSQQTLGTPPVIVLTNS